MKCPALSMLFIMAAATVTAQNIYKLNEKNSKLSVSGTSSLHDWEMEATGFNAETGLETEGSAVSGIYYITFSTPVSGMKSDRNQMEKKARVLLREDEFPKIEFTLKKENPVILSGNVVDLSGSLSIAGKTNEIKVPADFNILSDKRFSVNGKVHLRMSDYGIESPKALLGIVKADNEVVVDYDFDFHRIE